MKIVIDKMPKESLQCAFSEMDHKERRFEIKCRVDGFMCDLERDCCCEKLIALGDLSSGCN